MLGIYFVLSRTSTTTVSARTDQCGRILMGSVDIRGDMN